MSDASSRNKTKQKKKHGVMMNSGNVLKAFGEDSLKIMTLLINGIYETGEWSKDFIEFTMTALKKKPRTTKLSDHHTISLITHSKDNREYN
jgi:hypothetical protein